MTTLDKVKTSLRVGTDAFDDEIQGYINSAVMDLQMAGVTDTDLEDDAILTPVKIYVKLHFGDIDDGEFDRLKASYDEKKAQLSMADGYTDWLK